MKEQPKLIPRFKKDNFVETYFIGENNGNGDHDTDFVILRTDDHFRSCQNAVKPHMLENYMICLIKKGEGIYHFGNEVFYLKENTLCLIPPWTLTSWHSQTPWQEGFCCTFSDVFFSDGQENKSWLGELTSSRNVVLSLTAEKTKYFSALLEDILAESQQITHPGSRIIRTQLELLVRKAASLFPLSENSILPSDRAAITLTRSFVRNCKEDIEQLLNGKIPDLPSLAVHADRLHVSPNHLNDMVREVMGRSVGQHVQHELANNATSLLQQTDWQISEIAQRLGFNDSSYFTRFYKKHTLVTPSAIRVKFRR